MVTTIAPTKMHKYKNTKTQHKKQKQKTQKLDVKYRNTNTQMNKAYSNTELAKNTFLILLHDCMGQNHMSGQIWCSCDKCGHMGTGQACVFLDTLAEPYPWNL